MKLRLLTGVKFNMISCNPTFFSSGLTIAVFQDLINCPSLRDRFTILVIRGRIAGSNFLKVVVGMGSSSQDLVLRDITTLHISSSFSSVNLCSFGRLFGVGMYTGLSLSASLIFVILSRKNWAKSSARC